MRTVASCRSSKKPKKYQDACWRQDGLGDVDLYPELTQKIGQPLGMQRTVLYRWDNNQEIV